MRRFVPVASEFCNGSSYSFTLIWTNKKMSKRDFSIATSHLYTYLNYEANNIMIIVSKHTAYIITHDEIDPIMCATLNRKYFIKKYINYIPREEVNDRIYVRTFNKNMD